ncbi:uncharacterized protein B4U80_06421 [Leptotrombidium deliense]|uniref:Integrase catalytic domain-containing protein n=1 Tax=Leptotrombidium deliense TaxID=299467 RepID=A0A443RZU3_9ACAR|nr:uncharacterized protein B4U80_06421 [Leptotrombidium deliense]
MKTIEKLELIFSRTGIPMEIVSDNGTTFTSKEFQMFCANNGIKHPLYHPYHPSTNGAAERLVQTFKKTMNKIPENISHALPLFLLTYRNMPHSTTGKTPAELFLGSKYSVQIDISISAKTFGRKCTMEIIDGLKLSSSKDAEMFRTKLKLKEKL